MKWFFPSYSGDFRLVPLDPKGHYRNEPDNLDDACLLRILDPTAGESELLNRFLAKVSEQGWTDVKRVQPEKVDGQLVQEILLLTPLETAGKRLLRYVRPHASTLTALTFSDGKVVTTEGTTDHAIAELEKKIEAEKAKGKEAKAGASVQRPTPCCPECEPGSIAPASEVLLSFLTPEQHEDWARHRAIRVRGHLSGHDYLVMHRNSPGAVQNTKLCYDVTDGAKMDFHDVSVPPEEEVLAVKLILEHAEPWLRNEATCLEGRGLGEGRLRGETPLWTVFVGNDGQSLSRRNIFKNPFGGYGDGTESAGFAVGFGNAMAALGGVPKIPGSD